MSACHAGDGEQHAPLAGRADSVSRKLALAVGRASNKFPERANRDSLAVLEARFNAHPQRHPTLAWEAVAERLAKSPAKRAALQAMEETGGEPDVVALGLPEFANALVFVDCSPETPAGRRNTCYDRAAREARKKFPPEQDALTLAEAMGVQLLDERMYRALQTLGAFDTRTSSWLLTPASIRAKGGALFGDRRYDAVFTYHNGADSYYSVRGFRAYLTV